MRTYPNIIEFDVERVNAFSDRPDGFDITELLELASNLGIVNWLSSWRAAQRDLHNALHLLYNHQTIYAMAEFEGHVPGSSLVPPLVDRHAGENNGHRSIDIARLVGASDRPNLD